ncbi:hypothetical protein [Halegenticoccus tardaugens]|nr:hypothetical protein [Halegenticoccus tardaugens]
MQSRHRRSSATGSADFVTTPARWGVADGADARKRTPAEAW